MIVAPIPHVQIAMGFVAMVLSLPLILRRVPMNRYYGIRTRAAFESAARWYEINAFGGKVLFVFGLFVAAFGWWTRDVAPPPSSPWAPAFTAIPFLALVPALLVIRFHSRRK